tara:strand:- start:2029 stop:2163 length:135 start_codon:yes stop_codon:yes gene_type:complete
MSFQQYGKKIYGIGPFVKKHQWTKQTDSVVESWLIRNPHKNEKH